MTSYQDELDRQADALTEADERRRAEWRWPTSRAADLFPDEPDPRTPLEIAAQRVADSDAEARTARTEWVALLPELDPTTLACTACGSTDDWVVREIGIERHTNSVEVEAIDASWALADTLYLRPCADGMDDYTEEGSHEWLYCTRTLLDADGRWAGECGAAHAMPENVEWC